MSDPEREQVRREEIAALARKAEPTGTVWGRSHLAEMVTEPTPMTWALVQEMVSGRGGMGLMFEDLGFRPDPRLAQQGIYDLVCGRPYTNLSREPLFYANGLPMTHSFAALKAVPEKALRPKAELDYAGVTWRFWLRLPITLFRSFLQDRRLRRWERVFGLRLRQQILPRFAEEARREIATDLSSFSAGDLLARFEYWRKRTLFDFARESLKPGILADTIGGRLGKKLSRWLGAEPAGEILRRLMVSACPDPLADLSAALAEFKAGRMGRQQFLDNFGHRASREMELSEPRWAENAKFLDKIRAEKALATAPPCDPKAVCQEIVSQANLTGRRRTAFQNDVTLLQELVALRQAGRHHLMMGYAIIRRLLLELDQRYLLGNGIFYLFPGELPELAAGRDFRAVIRQRQRRRELALSLEVPPVLFSDDLDAIGRSQSFAEPIHEFTGVALSAGHAEGFALVLRQPDEDVPNTDRFILVCPSTDPAWVPLFARASGLVMELGGILSHGAIVAREFGLPAVSGIPDITRKLKTGQRLRVDGTSGKVSVLVDY